MQRLGEDDEKVGNRLDLPRVRGRDGEPQRALVPLQHEPVPVDRVDLGGGDVHQGDLVAGMMQQSPEEAAHGPRTKYDDSHQDVSPPPRGPTPGR